MTFKPFQHVLARDEDDERWQADIFLFDVITRHGVFQHVCAKNMWDEIIPYEGNEDKYICCHDMQAEYTYTFGDIVVVTDCDDTELQGIYHSKAADGDHLVVLEKYDQLFKAKSVRLDY